jgi:hypothetical protein
MDKIVPWQASCLISAQRKTGKTTFVLNLARSLLTGEDFLGRFAVRPINGDVAILNYEVSAAQLARWADEAGVPRGRLFLVNLRGRGNPLGDDDGRMRLAALLRSRGTEALLCDPFGRAYTGVSQNDPGEVGRWLDDLEHFARTDVGVNDLMLTAHAGWEGERTRGASALEDWPDSIITMTRGGRVDGDGGEDARYLKAIGRDVELEEDRLNFDMETRTLTLSRTGSRRATAAKHHGDELDNAVLGVITKKPGLKAGELGPEVRQVGVGFQRGEEVYAAGRLIESGRVKVVTGKRGAKHHYASDFPSIPDPSPGHVGTLPDPSSYGEGPTGGSRSATLPTRCAICDAELWAPASQQRGTCEKCYGNAEPSKPKGQHHDRAADPAAPHKRLAQTRRRNRCRTPNEMGLAVGLTMWQRVSGTYRRMALCAD